MQTGLGLDSMHCAEKSKHTHGMNSQSSLASDFEMMIAQRDLTRTSHVVAYEPMRDTEAQEAKSLQTPW